MHNTIHIATYNMHGWKSNKMAVDKIMEDHEITVVQEHWLYKHEIPSITEELAKVDQCCAFKTFDEDNPIPLNCKHRGQAGIGIIWKQENPFKKAVVGRIIL